MTNKNNSNNSISLGTPLSSIISAMMLKSFEARIASEMQQREYEKYKKQLEKLSKIYTAYFMLQSNEKYYPNFKKWFWTKVEPELDKDRKILFLIQHNTIIGVAIIKYSENKICSFRIRRKYRNKKNGLKLLKMCIEALNSKEFFMTVPEELLKIFIDTFKEYKPIIKNYSSYRKDKKEYCLTFNLGDN